MMKLWPLIILIASTASAVTVNLVWEPTLDSRVVGYNLYSGYSTRSYNNKVSAGNSLTGSITGLSSGSTNYFAVTAFDADGVESDFSVELQYIIPTGNINVGTLNIGTLTIYP